MPLEWKIFSLMMLIWAGIIVGLHNRAKTASARVWHWCVFAANFLLLGSALFFISQTYAECLAFNKVTTATDRSCLYAGNQWLGFFILLFGGVVNAVVFSGVFLVPIMRAKETTIAQIILNAFSTWLCYIPAAIIIIIAGSVSHSS